MIWYILYSYFWCLDPEFTYVSLQCCYMNKVNNKKFGPRKLPQENHNAWNPANDIRFTRIPNKNRYLLISSKYGILIDYKNVKVYYSWLSCSPVYHRRVGLSRWCKILWFGKKNILCFIFFCFVVAIFHVLFIFIYKYH